MQFSYFILFLFFSLFCLGGWGWGGRNFFDSEVDVCFSNLNQCFFLLRCIHTSWVLNLLLNNELHWTWILQTVRWKWSNWCWFYGWNYLDWYYLPPNVIYLFFYFFINRIDGHHPFTFTVVKDTMEFMSFTACGTWYALVLQICYNDIKVY